MAKQNKRNVYYELLKHEIYCSDNAIETICKEIGDSFVVESTALCWLEQGQTEKTIIKTLRKLGFDIPKEIGGSDQVYGN